MKSLKLVLVTGAPRSGTTAVGQNLAYAPGARQLYEPMGITGAASVGRLFEIPGSEDFPNPVFDQLVHDLRTRQLKLKPQKRPGSSGFSALVKRYLIGTRTAATYRLCKLDPLLKTIIWKDPTASLAAHRAATVHQIPTVVTIRTPLAQAASYKRLGWVSKIRDVSDRLARTTDYDFAPLVERYRTISDTPVGSAALLWLLLNAVFLDWARQESRIMLVDLEAVVADPLTTYEKLFRHTGLEFTEKARDRIRKSYSAQGKAAAPRQGVTHDRKRDPKSVNILWEKWLTAEELALINEITSPLWNELSALLQSQGGLWRTDSDITS